MPSETKQRRGIRSILRTLGIAFCILLLALGFLCVFAALWYSRIYGNVGFGAIVNTLLGPMDNVEPGLLRSFLENAAMPSLSITVILSIALFLRLKQHLVCHIGKRFHFRIYPFSRFFSVPVALLLAICLLGYSVIKVDAVAYFRSLATHTTFIEDHYVDPDNVSISFPAQKRNLIVIYLESMETSFFSKEQGGGNDISAIPELYELAKDNVNFSSNSSVGGVRVLSGSGWTVAALVSINSGVPLKTDFVSNVQTSFLPGLTALSDVLHQNGYYQALMVGSDSGYGGRRQFYQTHQTDRIYDLYTARDDGIVPPGYSVWWGMEDLHLFEYAKQEILKIAEQDQPFAFSMLTADTHHVGGYVCDLCKNEYPEQYENVLACSSRQVAAFVKWIQQQDFYPNTTIVITGDHCSMDSEFIQRNIDAGYDRRTYNCFINPAASPVKSKERDFCSLDMFPSILASIGCSIEGDRLGLGTNLFSSKPTLCEELGADRFNAELSNYSSFYIDQFL